MIVPFKLAPPTTAHYAFRARLTKHGHVWEYEIRPTTKQEAQCWVRVNGQAHDAEMVRSVERCGQVYQRYLFEVAVKELDGWRRE